MKLLSLIVGLLDCWLIETATNGRCNLPPFVAVAVAVAAGSAWVSQLIAYNAKAAKFAFNLIELAPQCLQVKEGANE